VQANAKYLLKSWAIVIFICCVVAIGLVGGMIGGLSRRDYTPFIAVAAGLAVVSVTLLRARRKAQLLFKDSTPDRAIAFYHSSMKRIPNGNAMAAYQSAFAAVLYGQFERAREELTSVNWATLPPMYRGFEAYIHSLLAIFEAKDYPRALSLAEEARDLCDVSDKFPGAKKSRVGLEANVAVCEMLTGKSDSAVVTRLDRASKELSGVASAIPSWALAVHYTRSGDVSAAERYLAVVKRLLPHDTPLNDPVAVVRT
jgi:hypothetical protein